MFSAFETKEKFWFVERWNQQSILKCFFCIAFDKQMALEKLLFFEYYVISGKQSEM